ncbi:MAG: M1 family metallopeptidase [Gemmatimonadaceae bacterium]
MTRHFRFLVASLLGMTAALGAQEPRRFSRADTLRGTNGPARSWWDVSFYDLHVKVSPKDSSISGWNGITYRPTAGGPRPTGRGLEMQVDLQVPLVIDSVTQERRKLTFRRDSNAYFVAMLPGAQSAPGTVRVYYHGKPRAAQRAPWDGGFVWQRDSLGRPFIATANQGLGASVWWPNKDWGGDEPDSQRVAITTPDSIMNVSNGRLRSVNREPDGTITWEWFVTNPINNYGISVNAGRYAPFSQVYQGEEGPLTLDFYPLAIHLDTARVQFQQTIPMMACFEHWFGPYPFYEDGFKLVETPHLGMEHQSAVAYGNWFRNGYRGRDLSATGRGLKWDFIIVHEAAHEWWANSITAKDLADMWVHESFANYAEGLYTECQQGKQAGAEYIIGSRANIRNDRPIIAAFGVNAQGSGDMYYKGGSMLHTIRQVIADDEKWRGLLRGAQKTFRHKAIDGSELRSYISREAGIDLSKVFEQYLTTTKIPMLEYWVGNGNLNYRWANVVPGFDMPVEVALSDAPTTFRRIRPTTSWSSIQTNADKLVVQPDYYVESKAVSTP